MATEMDLLPVRKTLTEKYNIGNERIGYDPNSGFVTIDGKNFMKPQENVKGTTLANPNAFNQAYSQMFPQTNNANDFLNKLMEGYNNPQVNPIDERFNTLLDTLSGRVTNPNIIDRNAVYQSPQYAAAQGQIQNQAGQAVRGTQEALGSSGFGRSTILSDRAQRIQNEANQQLETQILPQIMSQLQAQEDRKTADFLSLLGVLGQQQGLYDTRATRDFDKTASILDYLTGREDQAQKIQREEENTAYERAYTEARDKIADDRYKTEFDENQRQFGLNYALEKAVRDNQISVNNAELALSRERVNLQKEENKLREQELTNNQMLEEERGLIAGLRSGELTPEQALQSIEDELSVGFYTQEQADRLTKRIQNITPTLQTSKEPITLTEEQSDAIPSDKKLESMWETEGKPKGYGRIDWMSWYKDPKGRVSGTSFDRWMQLYGPKLRAK